MLKFEGERHYWSSLINKASQIHNENRVKFRDFFKRVTGELHDLITPGASSTLPFGNNPFLPQKKPASFDAVISLDGSSNSLQQKEKLSKQVLAGVPPIANPSSSAWKPVLVSLPHFAAARQPAEINFRWPSEADLANLNLTEPPKLVQIRTKGVQNCPMTAIQLVFADGLVSPLFDTNHP